MDTHTCTQTCICTHTHTHTNMHMHAHTETDAHTNACTYMHMICAHTQTLIHAHLQTHAHTHTNTHTHLVRQSRPSYMWCDDNIRMRPQFTAGWQRFLTEHIQYGTTNPPLSDRTDRARNVTTVWECLTVNQLLTTHPVWHHQSTPL